MKNCCLEALNIGTLADGIYPKDDCRTYVYYRSDGHIYVYQNGRERKLDGNYDLINTDGEDITTIPSDNVLRLADRLIDTNVFVRTGYKILRRNIIGDKNILSASDFTANTVHEIRYDFDLNGAAIVLPENCTLQMNGGSLNNGHLVLDDASINAGNTKSLNVGLSGTCKNKLLINNPNFGGLQLEVKCPLLILGCDLNINDVKINSSIKGCNFKLNHTGWRALIAGSDNLIVSECVVKTTITDKLFNYFFYSDDKKNITIKNNRFEGEGCFYFNSKTDVSDNITIESNTFDIDLTRATQDTYTQHDVFAFRGINGLSFHANKIKAININRLLKTASGINGLPNIWSERLLFAFNDIYVNSINGKQFWDSYELTRLSTFVGNVVEEHGHSVVFEHKYSESIDNAVVISDNRINYSFKLMYSEADSRTVFKNNFCESNSDLMTKIIHENGVDSTLTRSNIIDVRNGVFDFTNNTFTNQSKEILPTYLMSVNACNVNFTNNTVDATRSLILNNGVKPNMTINIFNNLFNSITSVLVRDAFVGQTVNYYANNNRFNLSNTTVNMFHFDVQTSNKIEFVSNTYTRTWNLVVGDIATYLTLAWKCDGMKTFIRSVNLIIPANSSNASLFTPVENEKYEFLSNINLPVAFITDDSDVTRLTVFNNFNKAVTYNADMFSVRYLRL